MTALIDIIIVGIIAITIIMAMQRGFVRTILGTLGFALALVVALAFRSPVSTAMQNSVIGDKMAEVVHSAIDSTVTEANYEKIFSDKVKEDEDAESSLERVFNLFGAEDKFESIQSSYADWREHGLERVRTNLKNTLTKPGVRLCCNALAYLVLFIGARILIKIIEIILDKVVALPVLRQANKMLGAVAGIILAVFRVFLLCFTLKLILPLASSAGLDWIASIDPANSVLYRFFENGNFLANIL